MPEAVTVATVAEPVARRISTATSQASSSTERSAARDPVGEQGADAGVDEDLLEAATGGDDQQDAGDRAAARTRGSCDILARSMPEPRPRVNIATMTAMSSAKSGVPRTSRTLRTAVLGSSMMMSASALPIISDDGQQDGEPA